VSSQLQVVPVMWRSNFSWLCSVCYYSMLLLAPVRPVPGRALLQSRRYWRLCQRLTSVLVAGKKEQGQYRGPPLVFRRRPPFLESTGRLASPQRVCSAVSQYRRNLKQTVSNMCIGPRSFWFLASASRPFLYGLQLLGIGRYPVRWNNMPKVPNFLWKSLHFSGLSFRRASRSRWNNFRRLIRCSWNVMPIMFTSPRYTRHESWGLLRPSPLTSQM
jgi:hypothetical protein